jgi:hypothetical protein
LNCGNNPSAGGNIPRRHSLSFSIVHLSFSCLPHETMTNDE